MLSALSLLELVHLHTINAFEGINVRGADFVRSEPNKRSILLMHLNDFAVHMALANMIYKPKVRELGQEWAGDVSKGVSKVIDD